MRMLSGQANAVKNFASQQANNIRSKRLIIFIAMSSMILTLVLVIPSLFLKQPIASNSDASRLKQQACCSNVPVILRRMIATYYTTEDGFQSTLVLNNKGPNQKAVTPILHGQNGQTFTAPSVQVAGVSSLKVDLNGLAASAGPSFRTGSFEFTYEGRTLEVGGGLRIVDAENSLIFDEQMLEPGMKFPSNRLEAVYAIPFKSTDVRITITNTTSEQLVVSGEAIFKDGEDRKTIHESLKSFDTKTIKLPHGLIKDAPAGAISLSHNGAAGALLAIIHLQETEKGYSETVNFKNPLSGKTTKLQGAGLRLGAAAGEFLTPIIAVRNLSDIKTTIVTKIPYSTKNGNDGTITLRKMTLDPGEIETLDLSSTELRKKIFDAAGVEIEYTGSPGDIVAAATSLSQTGNQVFTVPLKDPQGGLSSTGGYPWFIEDSISTTIFVKNVTDEPQNLMLEFIYAGGGWGKLQKIRAHQTLAFDVRAIRDTQMSDSNGTVIPPNVTMGHVSWSVIGKQDKVLIGRAQSVSSIGDLASTYECQCLCPYNPGRARLSPENASDPQGNTRRFVAQQTFITCMGQETIWADVLNIRTPSGVYYNSSNPNIASITSSNTNVGEAVAMEPGSVEIRGEWDGQYWQQSLEGAWCDPVFTVPMNASATYEVQCRIPDGEDTMATGWANVGVTQHNFVQRLLPISANFSGRRIYEQDTGEYGPSADTCWFEGSGEAQFYKPTNLSNQFWTVQQGTNEWGIDLIGYPVTAVNRYQAEGREPCQTMFKQRMLINCGNDLTEYRTNLIWAFLFRENQSPYRRKILVEREEEFPQRYYGTP